MMTDLHQGNRSVFELFARVLYIAYHSSRSSVYKSKLVSLGFKAMKGKAELYYRYFKEFFVSKHNTHQMHSHVTSESYMNNFLLESR